MADHDDSQEVSHDLDDDTESISKEEIVIRNLTYHLLSMEEGEVNLTGLLQQWIEIDEVFDDKFEIDEKCHVDLATILAENSEVPSWMDMVIQAFAELENAGRKLLKADKNTPVMWGKMSFKSNTYKTIDQMQGGRELLTSMGYTQEEKSALHYPGFPSSVEDERTSIARLTAVTMCAQAEIEAYRRGDHPNEHRVTEWARVDHIIQEPFPKQAGNLKGKSTKSPHVKNIKQRQFHQRQSHQDETNVSRSQKGYQIYEKSTHAYDKDPRFTQDMFDSNSTATDTKSDGEISLSLPQGETRKGEKENETLDQEQSGGKYSSIIDICGQIIQLEKEYRKMKGKKAELDKLLVQLAVEDDDFDSNSNFKKLNEKVSRCSQEIKEIVSNLILKKKKIKKYADEIDIPDDMENFCDKMEENSTHAGPVPASSVSEKQTKQESAAEVCIPAQPSTIEEKERDLTVKPDNAENDLKPTNIKDTWQCPDPDCRFINGADQNECEVCETKKPTDEQPNSEKIQQNDAAKNEPPTWKCKFCTLENHFETAICVVCGKTDDEQRDIIEKGGIHIRHYQASQRFDSMQAHVTEQMQGAAATRQSQQIVQRNQELAVLKQEEKQVLHPFHSAMKDGTAKIVEDDKDKKSQWDPLRDENLVKILTNKSILSERRARIMMIEGQIKEWYRAVNAVTLIDDPEIYGQGVTLRHIANAVNVLEGSVEECKKMLRQKCDACLDSFGTDQIQQLMLCSCKMCTDCFKMNFNVLIRDKDVCDWHCTLCHKPDMINNPNDALIEQHFQFLDIKVQKFLTRDTYAIFTQKLNDWNLSKNPNFVYCPFEGCVNGFLHHDRLRVTCTQCNRDFCWKCKNQWTQEHEDKTCDEAQLAQGEELIKEQMKENSIICPNPKCGFYFELARGGCMHFTCSKCKKQFCQCCLKDFYTDPKKGLTCMHPRNCLFHLRDWDVDQLEKMLEENDVEYENDENPEEKECRIMVTIEDDPGKLFETRCEEKVKRNQNGLCEKHYKEFLVRVINENNLDPVDMMSEKAISILLMREKVEKPPKDQGATLEEYRNELVQFVKEQLPLQQMQGKP